jgi:hypothetical protein
VPYSVKLFPILSLVFLCGNILTLHAESSRVLSPVSDTISGLDKRVGKSLDNIRIEIEDQKSTLDILKNEISQSGLDKKQMKRTKLRVAEIEKQLQFNYQKQNAYRHLLTKIRQLNIQNEENANRQLKEIDKAITVLEKNKLPSIKELKPIPSEPYVRLETNVYGTEISSLCNLTRNPDGKIIANAFENFFEYTDPKLSAHFKENDFLECHARFIKTKKEYFLELKFILNSPKAASIYGSIDPANPSKIDFIDNEFIFLETHALTSGILDPETGSTVYNVQYKLNREDIKNIRKKDVSSLTIIWTSGSDQFEICRIDLLRNLFECIQKRKLQN